MGKDIAGLLAASFYMSGEDAGAELPPAIVHSRTASILGWIFGYYVALWLLGFTLAVPILLFLHVKFGGHEKWPITIILTLVSWAFFYGLFEWFLSIPFPEGLLFTWLN